MEIIDMIKNDSKDSKWIVDQYREELLYVDDSFQRRYVWHEKHKIKLIETILLGYAIPEIYVWDVTTDPDTGDTKRSIVDGQQRIGALFSFINNEFKLKKTVIEKENAGYADKTFSDLSPDDKNRIWKYTFSIRMIKDEVSRDNIVKLFLRLNSTDKSLNPQELRNAEFEGMFLETAQEIAKYDFWEKHHIFSPDNIRRMGDIEFISSILIFLRMGISSEITQKAINEVYDMFDEKYEEAESDKEIVLKILNELDSIIIQDKSILPYLKKNTHLYTIMVVIYKAISLNGALSDENKKKLLNFYKRYDENNYNEKIIEFKRLMSDGTRSKKSRLRRTQILSEIVGIK
ncbi:DUF262 domain-containing protein [bacterium 1xD8-6]|nr:DUF262 domain-containing protein [bacterium D16-36]RKI72058.1 DUF262 domain-containing protein [bacterium 1xD8-6]